MKIWEDDEVKNLFKEVEVCKDGSISLSCAFANHAKKYGRKTNSVRNYYYKDVENLKKDKKRCQRLGIEIEKHEKSHFTAFDKNEEDRLLVEIENLTKQGQSVRGACKKLSGGDLTQMTRLQNKYQNLKKAKVPNNIISFKKERLLTESDINSLFMGLVKLIRKSAVDEFMEKTKLEKESSSYLLKRAFLDLNKKDKQITELRTEFESLKNENRKLLQKIDEFEVGKNKKLKEKLEKRHFQGAEQF